VASTPTGRRPGRPPRPDNLKRLEGNPGKRRLRSIDGGGSDAKAPRRSRPRRKPNAPSDLSDDAAREWRRVVPLLDERGLVEHLDVAALRVYCEAVALHVAASRIVAEKGPLVQGQRGNAVRNPAIMIQRQAAADIARGAVQFGLTPADRARPLDQSGATAGSDALARILAGEPAS
jgi:P27 family predicted phage terminase small subunit